MTNKDTVIKGLTELKDDTWLQAHLGYIPFIAHDAIDLLNEKPVFVFLRLTNDYQQLGHACSNCGSDLEEGDKYCHECGRRLMWE